MPPILAIGPYAPTDAAALQALGAQAIDRLADLQDLPPPHRSAVRGVAYLGHDAFGPAQMDLLPSLRVIANFGVGHDAIDLDAATGRGIVVTNTPDVLNDDVADLAVALWLARHRAIEAGIRAVRSGDWARGAPLALARKASGRRVGILGLGRIGHEIALRLVPFKTAIHYWSRRDKQVPGWTRHADPVALAAAVDDLIVAVVGGADTQGMVSAAVLGAMRPGGLLVNVARGSVVDEDALIAALDTGRLAGAALDVFRNEPAVDPRLAGHALVLPLPHLGSATVETRAAMGALQRRNLVAVLDGRAPETPVNG